MSGAESKESVREEAKTKTKGPNTNVQDNGLDTIKAKDKELKSMNRKWQQASPIERLGRWMVPQATMNRRGDIKSRVAWEMLERPPYVFVLYEPSTRTIGLRPCNSHIKDTFALKPDGLYGAQLLNVACLRVDLKVVTEHTIRFQDLRLDEEGTLILELAKATPAYHGRRVGAWHTERKTRLERQRQPHPHWLTGTK